MCFDVNWHGRKTASDLSERNTNNKSCVFLFSFAQKTVDTRNSVIQTLFARSRYTRRQRCHTFCQTQFVQIYSTLSHITFIYTRWTRSKTLTPKYICCFYFYLYKCLFAGTIKEKVLKHKHCHCIQYSLKHVLGFKIKRMKCCDNGNLLI